MRNDKARIARALSFSVCMQNNGFDRGGNSDEEEQENPRMSTAGRTISTAGGYGRSGARMSTAGSRMSTAGTRMSTAGVRMSTAGVQPQRMSTAGGQPARRLYDETPGASGIPVEYGDESVMFELEDEEDETVDVGEALMPLPPPPLGPAAAEPAAHECTIQVYLRIRPNRPTETEESCITELTSNAVTFEPKLEGAHRSAHQITSETYFFDGVLPPTASQQEVYEQAVQESVRSF